MFFQNMMHDVQENFNGPQTQLYKKEGLNPFRNLILSQKSDRYNKINMYLKVGLYLSYVEQSIWGTFSGWTVQWD